MKPIKINRFAFLLLLAGSLALSLCTERIDVELDDTYTRLVVDGQITSDETDIHKIILTESTSYFYNQPPPPVTNADVQVKEDDGNAVLLSEETPGVYQLPENFRAESGKTYTLDIQLDKEIDGQTHYTAVSSTPNIGDSAYITLKFEPDFGEKGFYIIQCYYWDPPGANWYMFNIYKNDTLLTDTLNEKLIVDDRFYDGGFTNGIGVGYLNQAKDSERLRPGDVITFQASSLTEGYANYVWQVQDEVSFSTPLFSGPPANVSGNISGGAIGYFTTYPVVYASTVFEP